MACGRLFQPHEFGAQYAHLDVHHALCYVLLIWIERIHALAYNITIDADSPLISYIPSTSWTRLVDDQNRVYMQTDDPDAYATIMYRCKFNYLLPFLIALVLTPI